MTMRITATAISIIAIIFAKPASMNMTMPNISKRNGLKLISVWVKLSTSDMPVLVALMIPSPFNPDVFIGKFISGIHEPLPEVLVVLVVLFAGSAAIAN